MKYNVNIEESDNPIKEQENESSPINKSYEINYIKEKKALKFQREKLEKRLFIIWILISIISLSFYLKHFISIKKTNNKSSNIFYDNSEILHDPKYSKRINIEENNNNENKNLKKYMTNKEEKVGVAFVYETMFGNGIGRMLSVLFSELSKYDKYDIYLLSKGAYRYDFKVDKKVKQIPIFGNRSKIEKFDKSSNVKYYVLHNVLEPEEIKWYKSLGKKIIDINHGTYLSCVYANCTGVYAAWRFHKLFDAFIQVIADDYYVHKKLGFKNAFYIPNMFTFDADKTPNSNLTYKNLMIMGRENDRIKGGYYGIKAMYEIVKEIPDAKLYFISSDSRIKFLKETIKELNLTNNIKIVSYVLNISHYFLNSSILLCPSKSESFPMVMNEGKAHGLPIIAFNVSYSPSYQKGVILVDMLNYTQMAKEAIKLLNDYEYRKKKGMEAKLSLKEYSNAETANKWDRLFSVLDKDDPVAYEKLQNYTFERYYDEEKARERLESNYNFGRSYNKYFCCHTFNDLCNLTYINHIHGCKNQSLCKK